MVAAVDPSRCCPASRCGSFRAAWTSRSAGRRRKQTIARALAEAGQARTWNLMIDVIAQTGNYTPGPPDLTDPTNSSSKAKNGTGSISRLIATTERVLGTQLEEVVE